jgi:hypothetical protein
MKTAAHLQKTHDDAISELAEVQAAIGLAIADGTDARNLQAKRDKLDARIRDILPAIRIAQDREDAAAAKEAEKEAERLRGVARESTEKLFAAADDIDAAIKTLGEAYSKYRLSVLDAKRAHLDAGSDIGAVERSVTHSLRWALAHGARHFLEDSGAARVSITREAPFRQSVRRTAPTI